MTQSRFSKIGRRGCAASKAITFRAGIREKPKSPEQIDSRQEWSVMNRNWNREFQDEECREVQETTK